METSKSRAGSVVLAMLAGSLVILMVFARAADASATGALVGTASSTPSIGVEENSPTSTSSPDSTGSTDSPQAGTQQTPQTNVEQNATTTSLSGTVPIHITLPDPLLPQITSIGATSSATSTIITWQTDNTFSSGAVLYGTTTAYSATSTSDLALDHTVALAGLQPATLYHFEIEATTNAGSALSEDRTFTTPSAAPVTSGAAPAISAIMVVPSYSMATISWTTDQPSSSEVIYGTTSYDASSTGDTELAQIPTLNHVVTLSGLSPDTAYHFFVVSSVGSSTPAASSAQSFTTTSM